MQSRLFVKRIAVDLTVDPAEFQSLGVTPPADVVQVLLGYIPDRVFAASPN